MISFLYQQIIIVIFHMIFQALLKAWSNACASTSPSKVVIPKGIFKLSGASLEGPCHAPIEFNLQGILQAPPVDANFTGGDTWVAFEYIDFLTVSGGGIFDGQGKPTWGKDCAKDQYCGNLPIVSALLLSLIRFGNQNILCFYVLNL